MADQQETPTEGQEHATDADTARQLDALAAAAEQEQTGQDYIPGAEVEPEHEGDPDEPDPQTVEIAATLYTVGFQIAASRRGDHWALNEQERDALADPTARLIEKYFPDMAVGPEAALILAAGMVTMPRLMMDRQIAAERERQRAEAERQRRRDADRSAEGATEGGGDGED